MIEKSFNIFLWLVIFFLISFILDYLWKRIFYGKKYRIFVGFGIIIHELSHALACMLTGAKIEEINLFHSEGGYVKHGKSKIPIMGQIFISFAPILGGIMTLFFFSLIFDLKLPFGVVNFQECFFQGLIFGIQEILFFIEQNWLNWQFWIFTYLSISTIICLAPSKTDVKNAFFGIFVVFIAGFILSYFVFVPQLLEIIFNVYLGNVLVLSVMLGMLAIIFTIPIFLFLQSMG